MRGEAGIGALIVLVLVALVVLSLVPTFSTLNYTSARAFVESAGDTVLSAGDFSTLDSKLNALKSSADAAVVNAATAATAANLTLITLLLHNENEVFLYPDSVHSIVTFTSGTPSNTFGA